MAISLVFPFVLHFFPKVKYEIMQNSPMIFIIFISVFKFILKICVTSFIKKSGEKAKFSYL